MSDGTSSREVRDILLTGFAGIFLSIFVALFPNLFLLALALPLPYVIIINKHGHRAGTWAVAVTALFNLFLAGFLGMVFTLVSYGLVAIVVGGAFYEKMPPGRVLVLSILAYIVSGLIFLFLFNRTGLLVQYADLIRQNMEQNLTILRQNLKMDITTEAMEAQIRNIVLTLPGIIASFSIVFGIVNYYISAYVLRKLKYESAIIKPFKFWIFPHWLALVYTFLIILLRFTPGDVVIANIIFVFTTVMIIEGIAVLVYYGDKWGLYPVIRNIIIIAILIPFNLFISMLGLVDNLFNLRKLRKKDEE